MHPYLALLLCLGCIAYLFRLEAQKEAALAPDERLSGAVWLPTLWLLILGSRSLSQWLNLGTPLDVQALHEGSGLIDTLTYAVLIVAAAMALAQRGASLGAAFDSNIALGLFFVYCLFSALWADDPALSVKRWIKAVGDPLMVLILLTEASPARAVATVMRRCAYVLVPLSVCFVKYFPTWGRGYSFWTGAVQYFGVTTSKNLLGYLLFAFTIFFVASLGAIGARRRYAGKRRDLLIDLAFLYWIFWLFRLADSKTAMVAALIGCVVVFVSRYETIRTHFTLYTVLTLLVGTFLLLAAPVMEVILGSTGRDATLTGRTELWAAVIDHRVNDLLGAGFESFWTGDRLRILWREFTWRPNQAHNGYIEVYLNLGLIGLGFMVAVLLTGLGRLQGALTKSTESGHVTSNDIVVATFGMAYLVAYLFYNITEATFKSLNFLFIVFLIVVMDYPRYAPRVPTWPTRDSGTRTGATSERRV